MLLAILAPLVVSAEIVTFNEPTTNDDATPLTDLQGHFIYRTTADTFTDNDKIADVPASGPTGGQRQAVTVPDQPIGTYNYSVRSYDGAGNTSAFSNIQKKTVLDRAPAAPSLVSVE